MQIYQGKLHAGTWPEGKVAVYQGGETWKIVGRVGVDGTEVNALAVYNGKLYGGSIPRAEVCRYDGDPRVDLAKRFYSPEGWQPALPGNAARQEYNQWSRVTSLTVYDGKALRQHRQLHQLRARRSRRRSRQSVQHGSGQSRLVRRRSGARMEAPCCDA